MFLRRKPNKSGTVSVLVVEKRNGKYVVLQSFGAERDEDNIRRLELKARQWMSERHGPQLPLFDDSETVAVN